MNYGSVCSGIEAATMAWHPLGWKPSFFSEIEDFPRAVLQHRYPDVPLHGDFTTIKEDDYDPIDLLVGGTPCQSFSIAGLREGLGDHRGNLALEYFRLAQRTRPQWLVWENVTGVLSSNGGRDFGSILGAMVELGYGFAYRVLDAQYVRTRNFPFAVPQRRRRVFVVGYLGDWRRAAAVLFDRDCLSGNPPPRREAGKSATGNSINGPAVGSLCARTGRSMSAQDAQQGHMVAEVASTLNAAFGSKLGLEDQHINSGAPLFVAFNSREDPEVTGDRAGPLGASSPQAQAIAFDTTQITSPQNGSNPKLGDPCHPLAAGAHAPAVAQPYSIMPMNSGKDYKARETEVAQPLMAGGPVGGNQGGDFIAHNWAVRRFTPIECERLQGFPDNFTNIPWRGKDTAPDGRRYKALGNSMAVNVMNWIGERIQMVEDLT